MSGSWAAQLAVTFRSELIAAEEDGLVVASVSVADHR
jgi:hypothetical protein